MRLRAGILFVLLLCIGSAPALARATTSTPTTTAPTKLPPSAGVNAALKTAEHSSGLWATINICNSRHHPDTIGVRAQMPALGFDTTMRMSVQLQYYSSASGDFVPLKSAQHTISLGTVRSGFQQQGVDFHVSSAAVLQAKVTFTWLAGRKLLGSTSKLTAAGIKHVQQSDPAGYSAAQCRIGS